MRDATTSLAQVVDIANQIAAGDLDGQIDAAYPQGRARRAGACLRPDVRRVEENGVGRRTHRSRRFGRRGGAAFRSRCIGPRARQYGRQLVRPRHRGPQIRHPGQHIGQRNRRNRPATARHGHRDCRDHESDRRDVERDHRDVEGTGQDDARGVRRRRPVRHARGQRSGRPDADGRPRCAMSWRRRARSTQSLRC